MTEITWYNSLRKEFCLCKAALLWLLFLRTGLLCVIEEWRAETVLLITHKQWNSVVENHFYLLYLASTTFDKTEWLRKILTMNYMVVSDLTLILFHPSNDSLQLFSLQIGICEIMSAIWSYSYFYFHWKFVSIPSGLNRHKIFQTICNLDNRSSHNMPIS